MKTVWTYLKAWYVWSKWTIQSLFLSRDKEESDLKRPGTDDQFREWNRKGKEDG